MQYAPPTSKEKRDLQNLKPTLREGLGNPIKVSEIWNPWRGSIWRLIFFEFLSKNVQYRCQTHTRCDCSRLCGVDVLWRHRWITSGMGLSHTPGWDTVCPMSNLADILISRMRNNNVTKHAFINFNSLIPDSSSGSCGVCISSGICLPPASPCRPPPLPPGTWLHTWLLLRVLWCLYIIRNMSPAPETL